jgi:tRNA G10  N-methylase Trm11
VKLLTIPDARFGYRKESIASSIAPANAALAAELARPYLKEDAEILDPFCGVGTMLIERCRAVRANIMYGIDIYGEAIEKARVNTALAGLRVNYINRDFFEFRHEYLFDEIITDLPQVTQAKDRRQIQELYAQFFAYAGKVLKKEAVMVLYASEPEFVRKEVKKYREYHICESYVINERQGTTVFVIEVKG